MISATKASFSPNSVTDEFNYRDESFDKATNARMYSALEIIEQIGIENRIFAHGKFTAAVLEKIIATDCNSCILSVRTDIAYASLFHNFQLMLDSSSVSNDIRPDVGIFLSFKEEEVVCIFEEDSTQNNSYEQSITRACHYSRAICRLKSMNNVNQEGVCFVFPSAFDAAVKKQKMAVVEVLCKWDYDFCRFSYSATAIPLNILKERIISVITTQIPVNVTLNNDAKYLYKFTTTDLRICFGSSMYHFNHQYSSARSIVLNVSAASYKYVMKFVDAKTYTILQRLKQEICHDSVLHYIKQYYQATDSPLIALIYDVLIQPLTVMEAKNCLIDFITLLRTTLQSVHDIGFEHCDLRLENICFRQDQDKCSIVLIDVDFGACTKATKDWKSRLMLLAKLSCLYRNVFNVTSVDYLQLGYMIVWICQYGKKVNGFEFASNDHYHTMDVLGALAYENDAFVANLINKGELFSFVLLI